MREHCSRWVPRRYASCMVGIRERARAEHILDIKRVAGEQLSTSGAAGVSLRAIARELGMVSSAIYRYFPSRDELLTALIVDAYDSIGSAAEQADAAVVDRNVRTRWIEVARSAYRWAGEHHTEYGLIFGTPVPGYAAPQDTIGPATRFTTVLLSLLVDAQRRGDVNAAPTTIRPDIRRELASMRARLEIDIDDQLLAAGLLSWVTLFGTISFIRFGHFTNVIEDCDTYFEHVLTHLGTSVIGFA